MGPDGSVGEDALLGGRVRLLQGGDGYRAAIDPVLLAAAAPVRSGSSVLDLGCGVGAAALCLAARVDGVRITGLDIQAHLVDLARRNAALNGYGDMQFVSGDVADPPGAVAGRTFDHVIANPPFLSADSGNPPADAARAVANVEGAARLADWVGAAVAAVGHKGSVTFIHRADRIDDLLAAFHRRLGGVVVLPLWPGRDKAAKRVIVSARKGLASPARICPGLVLHQGDGAFTAEADRVLRQGAGLDI